jgi:hypothetical protein
MEARLPGREKSESAAERFLELQSGGRSLWIPLQVSTLWLDGTGGLSVGFADLIFAGNGNVQQSETLMLVRFKYGKNYYAL